MCHAVIIIYLGKLIGGYICHYQRLVIKSTIFYRMPVNIIEDILVK